MLFRPISIIIALCIVAGIFITATLVSYQKFKKELIDRQLLDHQRLSRIITQSLNQYFHRVQQTTEFAASNEAFNPEITANEDKLRYQLINKDKADAIMQELDIKTPLERRNSNSSTGETNELFNWQLFKGLPYKDEFGNRVAEERRRIANHALIRFGGNDRDLLFVYEEDANGDMIFVEPFYVQKNLQSFNFRFRDYLVGAKTTRGTTLSEAFISRDAGGTQAVAVSSPIFDKSGSIVKIICASISNSTLRNRVFQPLKKGMLHSETTELKKAAESRDNTVFYLIDHYGHVVASSSDTGDYEPIRNAATDEGDQGNFRNYGPLKKIQWEDRKFQPLDPEWERQSKTWQESTLRAEYSDDAYTNSTGTQVVGTFYPVYLLDKRSPRFGILIETPITAINPTQTQLNIIFIFVSLILLIILIIFGQAFWNSYRSINEKILDKEMQLQQISSKVSHDIRSPLLALQMLQTSIDEQPEHIRIMFKNILNQVSDTANGLMQSDGQSSKHKGNIKNNL